MQPLSLLKPLFHKDHILYSDCSVSQAGRFFINQGENFLQKVRATTFLGGNTVDISVAALKGSVCVLSISGQLNHTH